MSELKLKPCPICGSGQPELNQSFAVCCTGCGFSTGASPNWECAYAFWNSRPLEAALEARVRELQYQLTYMQAANIELQKSLVDNNDKLFSQDESDAARIAIDHPDAYIRLSNGVEIQRSGEGERAVFMVCAADGSGAIADTWAQAWEWAWSDWQAADGGEDE